MFRIFSNFTAKLEVHRGQQDGTYQTELAYIRNLPYLGQRSIFSKFIGGEQRTFGELLGLSKSKIDLNKR